MTMTELRVVPAGAGAGKTHHIKQTLAGWVADGTVRPERILAVTFTEAAAGELRQRIRAALLDAGDIDAALAVERAYVSTIHALGQRVLLEHAFAAGSSPEMRLIEEGEQHLLIRRAIEEEPALRAMAGELAAHGYKPAFGSGITAEDAFRGSVLRLVNLLRSVGERGADPALVDQAEACIRAHYGPVQGNDADAIAALRRAVAALLAQFPEMLVPPRPNKAAEEAFRKNFASLKQARTMLAGDGRDWRAWEPLRKLRLSARGCPTPDGYDDLAQAVMDAAGALPHLPGPLEDAVAHARALVTGAQAVMAGYARAKRALGVIDYTDMIADAARLLRDHPAALNAILAEVDCVVIDECQDTSPIQFAFLWQLASRARRTLIVGDTKQAIMGFQGADPRLAAALAAAHPHLPLGQNWRSDPRIMELVNALGPCLFGADYAPLVATRPQGEGPAVQVLVQSASAWCKTSKPQHHVADHVRVMLAEGMTIPDRHSGALRPLEPRDIAVLCLRHGDCTAHADELRALGLPVRLAENGWWSSTVVQAAAFALRHVADPGDAHAALCWATLGPPAMELDAGLRVLADGGALVDEDLAPLHAACAGWSAERVLAEVIRAAGLRHWCDRLPDPAQARADLLRLEAEARAFDAADRTMRAAAAYHGDGVPVFLGWLEGRVAMADDARPAPSGAAADGVEVVTWHAAKGREWPVVVVATLGHNRDPRCGEYQLAMEHFADFDDVLGCATLTAAPDFAAPEATARCLVPRWPGAGEDCRRLLYVALTRARDRLVIEWPKPKKDKDAEEPLPITPAGILLRDCGLMLGDNWLELGGTRFPAHLVQCPEELPPAFEEAPITAGDGARAPRFALVPGDAPVLERIVLPSAAEHAVLPLPAVLETVPLAPGLRLSRDRNATDRGTAVHEGLRILLQRPDLADRVPARCRVDERELTVLQAQAEALRAELARRGFPVLHVEPPLDVPLPDGTRQTVILDLLAQGPGGWLVVDYKSGPVRDPTERFAGYWPQLSAYMAAVNRAVGGEVMGAAVFWTDTGEITVGMVEGVMA
jgi:ATP-dependent exoDNAse (exonuclease V) beta subunit